MQRLIILLARKNVLITDVSSCGKSLTVKTMKAIWGLPLLKLDMKKIFGGIVGNSEENIRKAIFTVNDISALPPEPLRKGRFDEIFLQTCPSPGNVKKSSCYTNDHIVKNINNNMYIAKESVLNGNTLLLTINIEYLYNTTKRPYEPSLSGIVSYGRFVVLMVQILCNTRQKENFL